MEASLLKHDPIKGTFIFAQTDVTTFSFFLSLQQHSIDKMSYSVTVGLKRLMEIQEGSRSFMKGKNDKTLIVKHASAFLGLE